jgi:uncharacterized cupin superfamily protein
MNQSARYVPGSRYPEPRRKEISFPHGSNTGAYETNGTNGIEKGGIGMKIEIKRGASAENLESQGVMSWPIWEKEASEFPWSYDDRETCYLLEGDVIVTPEGGEPVRFGKGDLVTFPAGMRCRWQILKDVRKHYRFG